jgi:nicotinamidase-related amidase
MPTAAIRVRPRYVRRYTDPGVPRLERNCQFAFLDWRMPLAEAALICLDVWDRDIQADMHERDDRVTRWRIAPLVAACRRHGLQIIHAPAPPIARRSPNWVRLVEGEPRPEPPAWPPAEFRSRSGPYARYALPSEPQAAADRELLDGAEFHPLVRPAGGEAVVASGEELHRLCAQRGVLHLFYVGFHTPGCMTSRNYGIPQMSQRGYSCVLVRDCTNGMETHETFDGQVCMRGAIAHLELYTACTLTSERLIQALEERA